MTAILLEGDVRALLGEMPSELVHTVVTSPPYWGLRDYGVPGQLGLEDTMEEWLDHMVGVFRMVRRVMRKDATCWVNIGDSYAANVGGHARAGGSGHDAVPAAWAGGHRNGDRSSTTPVRHPTKPKDLVGQPWRLALALQADGWYLRSDVIWAKPNPMPETVNDRPAKAHEHVFLLTRSPRYYYDATAVREPSADVPTGRNLRTVWTIPTEPYPEAHFATFPRALVEPCIRAGTSERGCCPSCGAPWRRQLQTTHQGAGGASVRDRERSSAVQGALGHGGPQAMRYGRANRVDTTVGWEAGCTDHKWAPTTTACTVLDPFAGSGTTGVVASHLGRDFIGIELSPEYAELARKRIAGWRREYAEHPAPKITEGQMGFDLELQP